MSAVRVAACGRRDVPASKFLDVVRELHHEQHIIGIELRCAGVACPGGLFCVDGGRGLDQQQRVVDCRSSVQLVWSRLRGRIADCRTGRVSNALWEVFVWGVPWPNLLAVVRSTTGGRRYVVSNLYYRPIYVSDMMQVSVFGK